jgi:hypothetical protein
VYIHRFLREAEPDVLDTLKFQADTLKGRLVLDNEGEECPLDGFPMT